MGIPGERQSIRKMIRKIEYDVPEFKKCLFCIPMRPAMIVWGLIQLVWITVITINAVANFIGSYYTGWDITAMFVVIMLVSCVEIIMGGYMLVAAVRSNWQHMNVYYNYALLKLVVYIGLVIVSLFFAACCYSENWYYYHLDPFRYYMLRENQLAGILECIILGYMLLIIRSYINELGGTPHCICSHGHRESNLKVFSVQHNFPEKGNNGLEKEALYNNNEKF